MYKTYTNKDSIKAYEALDTVTHKCFFDVEINQRLKGRIVVGLFNNTVPKTVDNFLQLCTGQAVSTVTGNKLSYKDSLFFRIIPGNFA